MNRIHASWLTYLTVSTNMKTNKSNVGRNDPYFVTLHQWGHLTFDLLSHRAIDPAAKTWAPVQPSWCVFWFYTLFPRVFHSKLFHHLPWVVSSNYVHSNLTYVLTCLFASHLLGSWQRFLFYKLMLREKVCAKNDEYDFLPLPLPKKN